MTNRPKKPSSGNNEVGYGRPPSHTRFRKGMSGDPGGRPRGMTAGRAKALALKEAYRPIPVREGEKVLTMPAIQVVLRNQVALAAKGNGPSQRALIETVQAIERELAAQAIAKDKARYHWVFSIFMVAGIVPIRVSSPTHASTPTGDAKCLDIGAAWSTYGQGPDADLQSEIVLRIDLQE